MLVTSFLCSSQELLSVWARFLGFFVVVVEPKSFMNMDVYKDCLTKEGEWQIVLWSKQTKYAALEGYVELR